MKQPLHVTIERWAIALPRSVYLKDKAADTGYALFDTRADALDIIRDLGLDAQAVKVRVTIQPARP